MKVTMYQARKKALELIFGKEAVHIQVNGLIIRFMV
jgi:hypothetical protein